MDASLGELFEDVWAEGFRWQGVLRRRWRFLPDVDAEMRAAVWEQLVLGRSEQPELFAAACVAVLTLLVGSSVSTGWRRVGLLMVRLIRSVNVTTGSRTDFDGFPNPYAIAFDGRNIWVANTNYLAGNTVSRVNPSNGSKTSFAVGANP